MTDTQTQGANADQLARIEHLCPRLMKFQGGALDLLRERAQKPHPQVVLTPARKGGFGLVSHGVTLDSTYHPVKSAAETVQRNPMAHAQLVVLLGAGGGSLPLALADHLQPTATRLLILEPDPDVLAQLFGRNPDMARLDERLVQFFTNARSLCFYLSTQCGGGERVEILRPPAYMKRYPESQMRLAETIREGLILGRISETDGDERTRRTFSNFLANYPRRHTAPSLFAIHDRLPHVPAVLVASGPSLDKNVHLLKEVQDQVLICAMNTSYQVLLSHGITPHLVFSMESKTTLRDFIDLQQTRSGFHPVISECSHPSLFKLNQVPFFTFLERDPFLIRYLRRSLELDHFGLASGGSVAHAAFSGAIVLGCDPVILIGQDLAYEDGRVYSKGNMYEEIRWIEDENGGHMYYPPHLIESLSAEEVTRLDMGVSPIQPVKAWDGKSTTMTSMDFKLFRLWFEEQGELRRRSGRPRLINATEGGCHIQHFEHLPLSEVIESVILPANTHAIRSRLDALWREAQAANEAAYPPEHTHAMLEQLRADAAAFRDACAEAGSTQMELQVMAESPHADEETYGRLLKKQEALETRIKHYADDTLLVSGLVSGRLRRLSRVESQRGGADGRYARKLYDLLMRGCEELIDILDEVLAD